MGRHRLQIDSSIVSMMRRGLTNHCISKRLKVSVRTVESRRQELMRKNKVHSAFQLGYLLGRKKITYTD